MKRGDQKTYPLLQVLQGEGKEQPNSERDRDLIMLQGDWQYEEIFINEILGQQGPNKPSRGSLEIRCRKQCHD